MMAKSLYSVSTVFLKVASRHLNNESSLKALKCGSLICYHIQKEGHRFDQRFTKLKYTILGDPKKTVPNQRLVAFSMY